MLLTSKFFPFDNNINIVTNIGLIFGNISAYKPGEKLLSPPIETTQFNASPLFEIGLAYQLNRVNISLKYQYEYIGISPEGYSSSGTLQSLALGVVIYV